MENQVIKIADNERFTSNIEIIEDEVFIHVDVHQWNKTAMQEMQILFDAVLERCEALGVPSLNFYGNKDSVRLAKSFAPLDFVKKMDNINYVGYWIV